MVPECAQARRAPALVPAELGGGLLLQRRRGLLLRQPPVNRPARQRPRLRVADEPRDAGRQRGGAEGVPRGGRAGPGRHQTLADPILRKLGEDQQMTSTDGQMQRVLCYHYCTTAILFHGS